MDLFDSCVAKLVVSFFGSNEIQWTTTGFTCRMICVEDSLPVYLRYNHLYIMVYMFMIQSRFRGINISILTVSHPLQ